MPDPYPKRTPNDPIRILLVGAGNVGRRFLELLLRKEETLRQRLGLALMVVGVADSSGAAVRPEGLDVQEIVRLKEAGRGVGAYPVWGRPAASAPDMVRSTPADLLVEASPAHMPSAQPGLACIESALERGLHVVTANKAPLVLAFPRLLELAREHGGKLRFDATVAGGLPAINLGRRDMAAAEIHRLEGILNLTSNYILTRMAQDGLGYAQALAEAQAAGHAETDPSMDVEGRDAANKLVILAHSVLHDPIGLAKVSVEGIGGIGPEALRQAAARGRRIKPVATAERDGEGYRYTVGPAWLDAEHPLAQLGPKQMGLVYYSDIHGVVAASIVEETPLPTAAAVLRDVIEICG